MNFTYQQRNIDGKNLIDHRITASTRCTIIKYIRFFRIVNNSINTVVEITWNIMANFSKGIKKCLILIVVGCDSLNVITQTVPNSFDALLYIGLHHSVS